jgi:hypothetical protein
MFNPLTWHKNLMHKIMDVANLNDYQLAWISFAKGVIVGVVLVLYSGLF